MDEHFDLANVGRTNQLHTQDEANTIRRLIIQKREALEQVKGEPAGAQLLKETESIKEDLIRFETALSPHKLLPNEILGEIFILLALDYGPVELPIRENQTPPQLALSHVCSRWRTVALCIPELWNNTVTCVHYSIYDDEVLESFNRSVQLNQQWILRAGDIPVVLSLNLRHQCDNVLEGFLSPIKVKKLHLGLAGHDQFPELCKLPDTAFPDLEELSLTFPLYYYDCNFDKPFFTRLQSVTFSDVDSDGYRDDIPGLLERLSLPWHQLQRFGLLFNLDCVLLPNLLRQMPNLRQLVCNINAFVEYPLPTVLSLPNLQNLTLRFCGRPNGCNEVIRSFVCPALTRFELATSSWRPSTFEAIKKQYNLERLQECVLIIKHTPGTLWASSILRNAPMLHSLQLPECAIMDTEAIAGLSNGTLGRFLQKLRFQRFSDATEIIKMAEKRKQVVEELIKDGCSWREKMSILREITICGWVKDDDETVVALKEAGITITGTYVY